MRVLSVIVSIGIALLAAARGAPSLRADEPMFPYTAYVNTDDVYIRSGPGKNYYPTDKLKRGDAVEIYRHDPGGWYAIRPPRGSFSWVPARLLRPTKDKLAVVAGDRVVSRVGTRLSDVRDVIQVRLDRGEQVEILEVKTLASGGQSEQWCKIAPPAGEFRWVFGRFVDTDSAGPTTESDRTASAHRSGGAPASSHSGSGRYYMADVDASTEPDAAPGVRRTSGTAPIGGSTPIPAATPVNSASSDSVQTELNAIDVAVSAMVVQDSSVWKFDDLQQRAQAALDRSQTAVDRGKARLLMDRIARFQDIQRRNAVIAQTQTATDRKNFQAGGVSDVRPPVALAQADSVATAKWDAVGLLTTVHSPRPNAPSYVLLGRNHEVVTFVTPAPGVNLRPWIGRQVGVSGQRGFIQELKSPHVTALRAAPVDNPSAVATGNSAQRR